jgi:hypothetical protein
MIGRNPGSLYLENNLMANQRQTTPLPPTAIFPRRKICSYDGMAVTAEVWDQAHTYHERALQAHARNLHGTGILSGLEVIASDPPDRIIFILPGAAIDPLGQVIVLPEAVAYDMGDDMEGPLYLLISHRQSPSGSGADGSSPVYSDDQFLITASPTLPDQPAVELARFLCESRSAPLLDAQDALRPAGNEIDLRYRSALRTQADHLVSVGTAYLGEGSRLPHGCGLARISRELRHAARLQLVVDDDISLGPNVVRYDLLYLVGQGAFKVSSNIARGLQGYLQRGGILLLESCDTASAADMIEFCGQLGVGLKPIGPAHPILSAPYLFHTPPSGSQAGGELLVGSDGEDLMHVIFSSYGYGRLWSGKSQEPGDQPPTREQLRAAVEFAANLIYFGLERQASA